MTLREIATVSGKPGLFRVFKPTRGGVILETLDEKKQKMVVGASHRVSILQEVSIYTVSSEGSTPLAEVLYAVHQLYPQGVALDAKSSGADYVEFMRKVLPDFDESKVYQSDMKKLASWYNILLRQAPDVLVPPALEAEPTTDASIVNTPVAEATTNEAIVDTPAVSEPEIVVEKPKTKAKSKAAKTEETTDAAPPAEEPKKPRKKKSDTKAE